MFWLWKGVLVDRSIWSLALNGWNDEADFTSCSLPGHSLGHKDPAGDLRFGQEVASA